MDSKASNPGIVFDRFTGWRGLLRCGGLLWLMAMTGCATLKIEPPGPDRHTLLVLPVEVSNPSGVSHAYEYIYDIWNADNPDQVPREAVFNLPLPGNVLIVDTLPPGNYYVDRLFARAIRSSVFGTRNNVRQRNDPFTLVEGGITIFSQSLKVVLDHSANPNTGIGITAYSMDMGPVTSQQREMIRATLRRLPNFEYWTLAPD